MSGMGKNLKLGISANPNEKFILKLDDQNYVKEILFNTAKMKNSMDSKQNV